jgi:hypothetical protein
MDDIERTLDDMRKEVMRKVKFGQKITDEEQEVRVLAFYPEYVLCMGKYGHTVCYRYHDLWLKLQHKSNNIKIPDYIKGWRVD